ncbi:sensor histidine kinase [Jatrophihabitans sp. YIM 134969]
MPTRWHARSGLTALAFALVVAGVVELAVGWTLSLLGGGLVLTVVGTPMAIAATLVVRRFAHIERFVAGRVLGQPVPHYYRPLTGNWWRRGLIVVGDPATWRDLTWLVVAATYGVVLSAAVVVLACGILWYAAFPLLWLVTPTGLFAADYGFVRFDSQASSFIAWAFAVAFALAWWWATPQLMILRARAARSLLRPTEGGALRMRVEQLAATRAQAVDASAAELRRIERDLHDGVQARLVALGMNLGLAEQMFDRDPAGARALIAEAREATSAGLVELRSVVRGIHPPVLADRGLVGAVQAAAMASPVEVTVEAEGVDRLSAPVESAVYFAVAELLTNVVRHSGAQRGWVKLSVVEADRGPGVLRAAVGDDGCGGACLDSHGSGLVGVRRRLAAFDGTVTVDSPPGGPTWIVLEVPCA